MTRHFKINGEDFTSYFLPYTPHTISYKPITGQNAGIMLSGKEYTDEIKINSVITLTCQPLTDHQTEHLLQSLYRDEYVNLEYYEPRLGDYRTISAKRSVSPCNFWGGLVGGDYWGRITVTFEERDSEE